MREDIESMLGFLIGTEYESYIEPLTEAILERCMVELTERSIPYAKELACAALDEAINNTVQAD